MGRRSKLTEAQWLQLERRHVVGGETLSALAREFGLNVAAVHRKINGDKSKEKSKLKKAPPPNLKALAAEKAVVDEASSAVAVKIAELPLMKQEIVFDLARSMRNTGEHLAATAESGAAVARHLSSLALEEAEKLSSGLSLQSETVDGKVVTSKDAERLSTVNRLTGAAAKAAGLGVSLIAATRGKDRDEPPPADAAEVEARRQRVLRALSERTMPMPQPIDRRPVQSGPRVIGQDGKDLLWPK